MVGTPQRERLCALYRSIRLGYCRDKVTRRANQQKPVQPSFKKYFAFAVGQISATSSRHLIPQEGRWPSSRTRGEMRWTRQRRAREVRSQGDFRERAPARRTNGAIRVRQNRVVPTPVAGAKLSVADTIHPDRVSH